MFHDGSPVTTRDVIATLRRMFVRDTQNQIFASLLVSMDRVDDRTFTLRLKEPFNYVEFLLGGSNGIAGSIMREKEALTDPFTPVKEWIGSGPFRFNLAEYKPGARLVYDRFDRYVPRKEPASGFAGGKVVKVDRVEMVIIPDPSTAYSAIRNGEVDFLDAPTLDLLPTVANDPNIVVGEVWPIETYAVLRFNHLYPPFDNLRRGRLWRMPSVSATTWPRPMAIRNTGASAMHSGSAAAPMAPRSAPTLIASRISTRPVPC